MYVFDNAAPHADARLAALADIHDPDTIRHLLATGVTDGWRCLEVGGGLGTITRWLSQRVGPTGYVLTTDIDTRFLETLGLANVEVRRHDITAGPLPHRTFDLAHTRLVLEHLSNPDVALDRMTAAIKPGGWLVVQDFETLPAIPGSEEQADRVSRTMAAMRRVSADAGVDQRLGFSLARRLRARGFLNVNTEGLTRLCRGNTASARLARLNFEQLREPMIAAGHLTIEQFNADIARLDDEDYEWRSPILWTASGQRPPGEPA
jgi:SAM-dependent methyltransferase